MALAMPSEQSLCQSIEPTMDPVTRQIGNTHEQSTSRRSLVPGQEHDLRLGSIALDLLPVAVAVMDGLGSIQYVNRAADKIVVANDGVRAIRGRLVAVRRSDQLRLQHKTRQLIEMQTDDTASRWVALRIERESGVPWLLMLTPLGPVGRRDGSCERCGDLVIALITDPSRPTKASTKLLQELHGLTATEAKVLGRLTDGMRLSEIAAELDISIETVRSHLKAVFGKTGTSRQAELIRYALLGGAWMHEGDPESTLQVRSAHSDDCAAN